MIDVKAKVMLRSTVILPVLVSNPIRNRRLYFCCQQAVGSLFVAYCDSQGYCRTIRKRLHTRGPRLTCFGMCVWVYQWAVSDRGDHVETVIKLPPSAAFEYFDSGLFFCNPILLAICTNTFSKLCKNMYTCMQWHVEERSVALPCN
jgi:hypothetical protein